jgi:hypothetical protein
LGAYNRATLAFSIAVEDLLHGGGAVPNVNHDLQRHATEKPGSDLNEQGWPTKPISKHHCEAQPWGQHPKRSNVPVIKAVQA